MTELVITLLLAAHLLAMNVASTGPLIGALFGGGPDGRRLSHGAYRLALISLTAGSLLGGVLLLQPGDNMSAALERFPSDASFYAAVELVFSAGCILVLIAGSDWLGRRRAASVVLALLSGLNLHYHFPPLMAVLGELAADPRWTREAVIDRAVLLGLWRRPEILALWAHFVLASFAVASIAVLRPWRLSGHEAVDQATSRTAQRLGSIALMASVLQVPVGIWLVSTNSGSERQAIMGGDAPATLCFAGSMLLLPWLLHSLMAVSLGEGRRAVSRASYLLVVITILMTGALRQSRGASGANRPLAASAAESMPSER